MSKGNTFGKVFSVTTFGESHGTALGCIIEGCPAGIEISKDIIQSALNRRRPGASVTGNFNASVTARKEADEVEILSGVFEGKATGTPIALEVRNTSQHSNDYGNLVNTFRPGHADYTYDIKYKGNRGYNGSFAERIASQVPYDKIWATDGARKLISSDPENVLK